MCSQSGLYIHFHYMQADSLSKSSSIQFIAADWLLSRNPINKHGVNKQIGFLLATIGSDKVNTDK